ncbi:hypothetical protein ACHAWF_016159 [Thalassiosira exigua]
MPDDGEVPVSGGGDGDDEAESRKDDDASEPTDQAKLPPPQDEAPAKAKEKEDAASPAAADAADAGGAAAAAAGTKRALPPPSELSLLAPEAHAAAAPPPEDPPGDPPFRRKKRAKAQENLVDHTYRDYSNVKISSDDEEDGKKTKANFPAKLHSIVSDPRYQHIICWQPHGRSWKIVDKHLLTTIICPKHFSHDKFESFNRSVNGWGFKRLLAEGPDKKTYYHECFLRGRPGLTVLMRRLTGAGKRLPDTSNEPDFYDISKKYPLPPAALNNPDGTPHRMNEQAMLGHQPVPFGSPPHPHQAGYFYGYPPPPHPQVLSPAANAQGPGGAQPPPQMMYWGHMASSQYQPGPYGYYPYPQVMPGPQGYYPPQPYMYPPGQGQFYPGAPGAPVAPSPTAASAPTSATTTSGPGFASAPRGNGATPADGTNGMYEQPGIQQERMAGAGVADPEAAEPHAGENGNVLV